MSDSEKKTYHSSLIIVAIITVVLAAVAVLWPSFATKTPLSTTELNMKENTPNASR